MKKPIPTNRILLIASYWAGDKDAMRTLLHLLADIEPEHNSQADLLLVNRFDCQPFETATIKHLSRKFNIRQHRSARRSVGWPRGCNSLAFGALEYFYHKMEAGLIPHYRTGFLIEADCAPLNRDWIKIFVHEWDRFKNKVYVAGAQVEGHGVHRHINGNCFLSGDLKFLNWLVKQVGEPKSVGWDYLLAEDFRRWGAAEMPGMKCFWGTPSMDEKTLQHLQDTGTIWLHGVKNQDAIQFARKTLI